MTAERVCPGVCEVCVTVPRGSALLFNGNIRHAGRAVESGTRHVWVASFDLMKKEVDHSL